MSDPTSTADTVTLKKLESHYQRWKDFVDWAYTCRTPRYPSLFGIAYQPYFHGRLEAFKSLGEKLTHTILQVTGDAWAIPYDGRLHISFGLEPMLYRYLPHETSEEVLENAVSKLENLREFDRKLQISEDRGFFVADKDPFNKGGDNGNFIAYRFGWHRGVITSRVHLDERNLCWDTRKFTGPNAYVANPGFLSHSSQAYLFY